MLLTNHIRSLYFSYVIPYKRFMYVILHGTYVLSAPCLLPHICYGAHICQSVRCIAGKIFVQREHIICDHYKHESGVVEYCR